jgi:6-phosphogluconate dehydrogenase
MNAGVPATVINESVSARFVSALKDDRVIASTKLAGPSHQKFEGNLASMVDDIRKVT